jgi:hypothetical protein
MHFELPHFEKPPVPGATASKPATPAVAEPHFEKVPSAPAALKPAIPTFKAPGPKEPKGRLAWLGNKTGTPIPRGARSQHHAAEVGGSSYGKVKP